MEKLSKRLFMNALVKHTFIGLAIIVPIAAVTAYAEVQIPNDIVNANTPTAIEQVDLKQYQGTWYEIEQLPMYFQRNCVSDVTATYALQSSEADSNKVAVINRCVSDTGDISESQGFAVPAIVNSL